MRKAGGRGIEEAGKMPPAEISGLQPRKGKIQMVVLHEVEGLLAQLFSTGEIIGHGEVTPGLSAIFKERAAGVSRHGNIDA